MLLISFIFYAPPALCRYYGHAAAALSLTLSVIYQAQMLFQPHMAAHAPMLDAYQCAVSLQLSFIFDAISHYLFMLLQLAIFFDITTMRLISLTGTHAFLMTSKHASAVLAYTYTFLRHFIELIIILRAPHVSWALFLRLISPAADDAGACTRKIWHFSGKI